MTAFSIIWWLFVCYFSKTTIKNISWKVNYTREYKRCVHDWPDFRPYHNLIYMIAPMSLIILLYGIMILVIFHNNISTNRLLLSTSAIIFTGVITCIPGLLKGTFGLDIPYELLMVLMTLYYANGICNPIIYMCSNPRVKKQLVETTVGRGIVEAFSSIWYY